MPCPVKVKSFVNQRPAKSVTFSEIAIHSLYSRDQCQLQASASAISHRSPPPFSAHFATVAIDVRTGNIRVIRYVAAVDCGTAINPVLAEGQTEGGRDECDQLRVVGKL